MVIKNIDFEKYNKMAEKSFYRKLGKVVNVVGLTIESAGLQTGGSVPDPSGCGRGKAHHGRSGRLP